LLSAKHYSALFVIMAAAAATAAVFVNLTKGVAGNPAKAE
jgi:hypothetical protein